MNLTGLIMFVIQAVIVGGVIWIIQMVLARAPLPEPMRALVNGVLWIVAVVIVLYLLLGVVGNLNV